MYFKISGKTSKRFAFIYVKNKYPSVNEEEPKKVKRKVIVWKLILIGLFFAFWILVFAYRKSIDKSITKLYKVKNM